MRALGLDLGSKRIGVAVSDSDGRIATPIEVVHRTGDRQGEHSALADLAEEWEVEPERRRRIYNLVEKNQLIRRHCLSTACVSC